MSFTGGEGGTGGKNLDFWNFNRLLSLKLVWDNMPACGVAMQAPQTLF